MTAWPVDAIETAPSREAPALPVGVADFADFAAIRRSGGYYADKTDLLHSLVSSERPYFLSRPRRFGKSLTVSVLENILKGRRELFKGLAICGLGYDWTPHPVLKLQINDLDVERPEEINDCLSRMVARKAKREGLEVEKGKPSNMLGDLIEDLYLKNREKAKVAVLIDECDAPILEYFGQPENAEIVRKRLAKFYSVLKTREDMIGHIFITGVTRFAKTSMFSSLNNLHDLTFDRRYSGICGLTEADLDVLLDSHQEKTLKELIARGRLTEGSGRNELRAMIEDWYDGYSWDGETKVFNPWSVLSFFDEATFRNYWYESGSPTFLIDQIRTGKIPLQSGRREPFDSRPPTPPYVPFGIRRFDGITD